MSAPALFIDDGYTITRTIKEQPGVHPACEVVFRPALDLKREEYRSTILKGEPAKLDDFKTNLLTSQLVSIGDQPLTKERSARRIVPMLRNTVVDLILGFVVAPELVEPMAEPEEASQAGN